VSSGTWSLVGVERPVADTSERARGANFSNEPGVAGGVRFLKNVMGMWLLEQCRAAWGDPPLSSLLGAAEAVGPGGPVVDATDDRFLAPADMEATIRAASGLPSTAGRDRVVRCILDSLATATAGVLAEVGGFVGGSVSDVWVIGGGAQNTLLNRLIEEAAGVPVRVGAVEATALGNALMQGVALGVYADLAAARATLTA
jgi:rhamnulokinase